MLPAHVVGLDPCSSHNLQLEACCPCSDGSVGLHSAVAHTHKHEAACYDGTQDRNQIEPYVDIAANMVRIRVIQD